MLQAITVNFAVFTAVLLLVLGLVVFLYLHQRRREMAIARVLGMSAKQVTLHKCMPISLAAVQLSALWLLFLGLAVFAALIAITFVAVARNNKKSPLSLLQGINGGAGSATVKNRNSVSGAIPLHSASGAPVHPNILRLLRA